MFKRAYAIALLFSLSSLTALAADLKIKDSRGTEVVVTEATIDYSGMLSSDKESDGIRLLQGDGQVTVKWSDIQSLTFVRTDTSVKPARTEFVVTLKNGKKVPASLFTQGAMKLTGKTDLGAYSIGLDKVRTITPVR